MPDNPTTALVKAAQSPALARVANQLTLTDKLLTKPEEPFLIPYRKGDKWGYCDRNKNIVIDCIYDFADKFYEDRSWVLIRENDWYIIDKKGKRYAHYCLNTYFHHDGIGFYSEGLVSFRCDCEWVCLDKYGKVPFPTDNYFYIGPFKDGFAHVTSVITHKVGLINRKGEEVIPCQFDTIGYFIGGFAPVIKSDKKGYLDIFTSEIYEGETGYNNIHTVYNEELKKHKIAKDSIDYDAIRDKLSLTHTYDEIHEFSEGLASVTKNGKLGYINLVGELVIPIKYDHRLMGTFTDGIACVWPLGEPWSYIDKNGTEFWED